ncbi:Hypothetical predicted protein, partial [Pelobates cultripes]
MADPETILPHSDESSNTLQHLDALFATFWRKLQTKQSLPESAKTPTLSSHTKSCPVALPNVLMRLRWQKLRKLRQSSTRQTESRCALQLCSSK